MNFSIISFPQPTDDVMQWLESSNCAVSDEIQEGEFPTIQDFLTATNSNHDIDFGSKPSLYELEIHVTSKDNAVDFIVTVAEQKIADLRFRGELDIAMKIMNRLTSKYGGFIIMLDGEPMEVVW